MHLSLSFFLLPRIHISIYGILLNRTFLKPLHSLVCSHPLSFYSLGYPSDEIILENDKNPHIKENIIIDFNDKDCLGTQVIPIYYVHPRTFSSFPAVQLSNLSKYIIHLYTFYSYLFSLVLYSS